MAPHFYNFSIEIRFLLYNNLLASQSGLFVATLASTQLINE